MEESKTKESSFLLGLCITLGTIVVGLISYVIYTTNFSSEKLMCEYNGWAYSDKDTFASSDGCNQCACSNGQVVCTEMACNTEIPISGE
ncbi:MAG: hypothetical protein AB9915_01810 [Candidatus Dojkabacteria bacterium]